MLVPILLIEQITLFLPVMCAKTLLPAKVLMVSCSAVRVSVSQLLLIDIKKFMRGLAGTKRLLVLQNRMMALMFSSSLQIFFLRTKLFRLLPPGFQLNLRAGSIKNGLICSKIYNIFFQKYGKLASILNFSRIFRIYDRAEL